MFRKLLPWPTMVLLAVAISCSDDNGKDKDAGPDMAVPTDGLPDKSVTPDIKPDVDVSSKPVIDKMIPSDGFANSNTPVVITGKNFKQGARVFIDGGSGAIIQTVSVSSPVSLSFIMPQNPYGNLTTPQTVSVAVMVNTLLSNSVDFQYTVTQPMDAKFKGSVLTASTSAYKEFSSDPIEAQIFVEGTTDTSTGDSGKITAQIGYGTVGKDPSKEAGFKWFSARFNRDDTSGYDIYDGTLTVPLSQTYDVAFRFSQDGGKTWVYADTDETDLSYDTAKAAKLTAKDAPPNYCQSDGDCNLNAFKIVCKIDTANKDNNQCVECLKDGDCTSNAKALGPFCETSKYLCYCAQTTDCTKNVNGHTCLGSGGGYCGCNSDSDCDTGAKCSKTPDNLQLCM